APLARTCTCACGEPTSTTVSPASRLPSASVSTKTIHAGHSSPAPAQLAPSTLRHITTRALRRTASMRADCTAASGGLAVLPRRFELMSDVKPGTAIVTRIAATASVTISSTRVKPGAARNPRKAAPPASRPSFISPSPSDPGRQVRTWRAGQSGCSDERLRTGSGRKATSEKHEARHQAHVTRTSPAFRVRALRVGLDPGLVDAERPTAIVRLCVPGLRDDLEAAGGRDWIETDRVVLGCPGLAR